jgi:hypothetical protein
MRRELRQKLRDFADRVLLVESRDDVSPLIHLRATPGHVAKKGVDAVEQQLQEAVDHLLKHGVVASRHLYNFQERVGNTPSLRLNVKGQLSETETVKLAGDVVAAIRHAF